MGEYLIALAGNPNVGKSTVFNALTGMNQHTGNWPGKTVGKAEGKHTYKDAIYTIIDLPGTYSLMSHSQEEEVARDCICFSELDAVIVVCDATCLERNLNLVLQTLEITSNVIVCINLMDEAKKKNIQIDIDRLHEELNVPIVPIVARSKSGLDELDEALYQMTSIDTVTPFVIQYPNELEMAITSITPVIPTIETKLTKRWIALRLLEGDRSLIQSFKNCLNVSILDNPPLTNKLEDQLKQLECCHITKDNVKDYIVSSIVCKAERIAKDAVTTHTSKKEVRDRKLDRILTNKITGIPIMLLLLLFIFWITITGANYPSQLISRVLFGFQEKLTWLFQYVGAPEWLRGLLVDGMYRVLAWVVSVMLPPMAIFFPLFTLLEDFGYLPRVAYNLDHTFKKCKACGKQALTMCMGFGCNAVGVTGCRIIDSPRERLIAIITNNFVPCNGRFPTIITIISLFFVGTLNGPTESLLSTVFLTGVILLGIFMTFIISRILSSTILKGIPSSFALELPPYRRPQFGKVIVRSILDRTLFVLGRAISVAAPAGLIIWILANVTVGDMSLLLHCTNFLDPFARLFGLDGVILMAFILGFPANEIVMPIILMSYLATGTLTNFESLADLQQILVNNGWTWVTAASLILFSLMHWPCSTTCLTIKKETKSYKWTAISILIPTVTGFAICFVFNRIVDLIQYIL